MFWTALTRILLRNRFAWLVTVAFATAFMAYQGTSVEMTYEFAKLMPETDSVSIEYNQLVEEFGQASNTVVIAMEDADFFQREHLEQWLELMGDLKAVDGIEHVQSLTEAYGLLLTALQKNWLRIRCSRHYQKTVKKKLRLRHELKVGPSTKGFCTKAIPTWQFYASMRSVCTTNR
jgi:hypothetical protein